MAAPPCSQKNCHLFKWLGYPSRKKYSADQMATLTIQTNVLPCDWLVHATIVASTKRCIRKKIHKYRLLQCAVIRMLLYVACVLRTFLF